jgi:mRNA-degrading endonuclease RelE of RelBE toxin-antitoxin system
VRYKIEIRKRAEKDLTSLPKADAQRIADALFLLEGGLTGDIKKLDFLRLQEEVEDYHDLRDLRKAKADPKNRQGRPLDLVAATLGLKRKS